MFDKRDRVIFDPEVKDVPEYAPLVKPGVFTVTDSNEEKDTDVLVDCIMEYVPNNTIIDDIKEQLKQVNNQLKKEENENRLQEKRISELNGVSNYEGGIPSRAYKTRIAVCNLVHQTGIRGQKSKA